MNLSEAYVISLWNKTSHQCMVHIQYLWMSNWPILWLFYWCLRWILWQTWMLRTINWQNWWLHLAHNSYFEPKMTSFKHKTFVMHCTRRENVTQQLEFQIFFSSLTCSARSNRPSFSTLCVNLLLLWVDAVGLTGLWWEHEVFDPDNEETEGGFISWMQQAHALYIFAWWASLDYSS